MDFAHRINTAGTGLWSASAKEVSILSLSVPYINEEKDFGELCVYFDTDSWDISKDGLIYTDDNFMYTLQILLNQAGLTGWVSYSEQGMQGEDYVSCDVTEEFLNSWIALNGAQE